MRDLTIALALLGGLAAGAAHAETPPGPMTKKPLPDRAELVRMAARYAPVAIRADLSKLSPGDRKAVGLLCQAARVMDTLYLRQISAGNETMLLDLIADHAPLGQARLHYFLLNMGPWSSLDDDVAFLPGVGPRLPQASFYPPDAAKEDVEKWWNGLPEADQAAAKGFFSTIRRDPAGKLMSVPYSVEFQGELAKASALLHEAAEATDNATLKKFLESRAAGFLSNDYYASDVAWMQLDAPVEPTIGPYEVYEDGWFNAKAAFEAFIAVRDEAESTKLQKLSASLQELEDHLPIDPAFRNPKLGSLAPIRVVNVVMNGGEANRGVQTAAYNLPNDERVVKEMGSKRVMLKNIQQAKFAKVLTPIAGVALPLAARKDVSFDAFFTHILMHELMHGLGPHNIEVGGRQTTVRAEMKEIYSVLEEAKADISGLWALQYLVNKGVLDKSMQQTMYTTFLASAFRSIRFGLNEAHGRGIALQLNVLIESGSVKVAPDGTFSVNPDKIQEAVASLTRTIMTLQGTGDYAKAKDLLDRVAVVKPEVKKVLDRLVGVPVDIEPQFVTADELMGRTRTPSVSAPLPPTPPKHAPAPPKK